MMKTMMAAATATLLTTSAFAEGEDHAGTHFLYADVEWSFAPMPGFALGQVWGDAEDGKAWLFRLDPGVTLPMHWHSHDYWGMAIQGQWVHLETDGTETTSGPGDYSQIKVGVVHGDRCDGDVPCIALLQFVDGPRDGTMAE
jgi:quercetin dioxygenase-like cupin family protein